MKIDNAQLDKKTGKLLFTLSGANEAFANSIRRTIMDEVPTLAVETVEFKDNSSPLYDEIVSHRLGLIPIKTDLKSYTQKKDCTCEGAGCAKCQLTITLKSNKKGIVTASEATSADPKCGFVYDAMPITKLLPKQKIEFTATAELGVGKEHAKWSPGLVFYRHELDVDFDEKKLTEDAKAQLIQAAPQGSFTEKNNKITYDAEAFNASINVEGALSILHDAGIKITDAENLVFVVESWGQLTPKDMLEQAAELLLGHLEDFSKSLAK